MKALPVFVAMFLATHLSAQHEHHKTQPKEKVRPRTERQAESSPRKHRQVDTTPKATRDHQQHPAEKAHQEHMDDHNRMNMNMSHAFSRNLPMTRNGSGTSWLPDNSPMYAYMFHSRKWMYMLHGGVYIRYNKQDLFDKGNRGGSKFDAPNMVMLMGQRNVGRNGLFHFNSMFSLDPLTIGEEGYPLLFQTGETYSGEPLVDRQHPHDLISELSVSYAHALSRKADVFLYVGYPGEPALGPAAFVHRPSGFFNPDAPLTHHWVDATHITFGVATMGLRYGRVKIEGSSFTGREPGENRYNFDKPRFDSWSTRLSFNPSPSWALQVSHGFIKEPEALHPGEDIYRTTASATYSSRCSNGSYLNLTGLLGINKARDHDAEHGVLAEGSWQLRKTIVYSRYEWVQKSVEELDLDESVFGHDAIFPVHAVTLGASYNIFSIGRTNFALGGHLSMYNADDRLTTRYGNNPLSGQVYLRIFPMAMVMNE